MNASYAIKHAQVTLDGTTHITAVENYLYALVDGSTSNATMNFNPSSGWAMASALGNCANYSNVSSVTIYESTFTWNNKTIARTNMDNYNDSTSLYLVGDVSNARVLTLAVANLTSVTYHNSTGGSFTVTNRTLLARCENATITAPTGTATWSNTLFSRTKEFRNITDLAILYHAQLASNAVGAVTITNSSGTALFVIPIGNITANDAPVICTGRCTVTPLIYGGNYLMQFKAKITSVAGVSRDAFVSYVPAGMMSYGDALIKFGVGERLDFYVTPYTNNTLVAMYYEVK
jgi:hypothetical protein